MRWTPFLASVALLLGACRAAEGSGATDTQHRARIESVGEPAARPDLAAAPDAQDSAPESAAPEAPESERPAPTAKVGGLPVDWPNVSAATFARWTREWSASETGLRLDDADRAGLAAGLDTPGTVATRAAVTLAHAAANGDGAARKALVERLAKRRSGGARPLVAGDVVAAGALLPYAQRDASLAARLARLASSEEPHPDLAVRVECARSALAAGRDEVIPFLLQVLRAETPAQELAPPDWPRMTTLAWVKTRASEALAARLGIENTFRPDGSWQHQVDEAARLEPE